jgi:sec-independent protein translocase protein TatC
MATIIQNPSTPNPNPDPDPELSDGKQMSFLEHLEELRKRLLRSVYSIIVGTGICFYFRERIIDYLNLPITGALRAVGQSPTLKYHNPVDPFNLYIKISIMAGIFLASPYILWQLWLFISPGLYRHEKRYVWPFVSLTSGLFISGGFFAYKLALPKALLFLFQFAGHFEAMVTINEYYDLSMSIIVAVGVVFELPAVILVLSIFGIVTPKFLLKNFRYAVLITAVLAAGIVPSNDMASIFVVWIPLVGLYILSIGLSWLVYFSKNRKRKREQV